MSDKRSNLIKGAGAVAAALWCGAASAGERTAAQIACQETDERLVFDCDIMLEGRDSGDPIVGAEVVVKADMPSMPMAHNVRPVAAEPAGMPGHYRARLKLEMRGEWALTLDVTGPTRDRVVETLQFGEGQKAGHEGMEHGQGGMRHDE